MRIVYNIDLKLNRIDWLIVRWTFSLGWIWIVFQFSRKMKSKHKYYNEKRKGGFVNETILVWQIEILFGIDPHSLSLIFFQWKLLLFQQVVLAFQKKTFLFALSSKAVLSIIISYFVIMGSSYQVVERFSGNLIRLRNGNNLNFIYFWKITQIFGVNIQKSLC